MNLNPQLIVVIVINNSDKHVGLYSGGLIFGGGGYIWNEVSLSTCGGLIHGGGLIFGGGYIRRFTEFGQNIFLAERYINGLLTEREVCTVKYQTEVF